MKLPHPTQRGFVMPRKLMGHVCEERGCAAAKKYCQLCRIEAPLTDFRKCSVLKDLHDAVCRACRKRTNDLRKAEKAALGSELKPKRYDDAAYRRKAHLQYKRGISQADHDRMAREQGNVCAICQLPETKAFRGKVVPLSVDHDHRTGGIRGLVCHRCNCGLSYMDRPEWCEAAKAYLARPQLFSDSISAAKRALSEAAATDIVQPELFQPKAEAARG